MRLADVSIRRPVFAAMLIAALVVFGILSYPKVGVDLFPNVEFPIVTVTVVYPGGDPETIQETLRVGINADHPDTRFAQMLAFDGVLSRDEIRTVANYVQSLSGMESDSDPDRLSEGRTLFEDNCTSCHGENATGSTDMGAPNLTDGFWIYGGDDKTLFATILHGRQGWMPAWEDRLDDADRKVLTVYLQDLKEEAR